MRITFLSLLLVTLVLAGCDKSGSPSRVTPSASPTPSNVAPVADAGDDLAEMGDAALRDLVGSTLADVEREFIEMTIRECDGSIPRAARILDVSPSTLYRKREAWQRSAS